MSLDYKMIGKRIRRRRKAKKWTQEQFAEQINRSFAFVGHIERGTRIMSLNTLSEIAKALDCSTDELLGLELKREDVYVAAAELLETAQALAKQREYEQE